MPHWKPVAQRDRESAGDRGLPGNRPHRAGLGQVVVIVGQEHRRQLWQEGRGIGLKNKILAYKLQEEGYDTLDANIKLGFKGDERDYGIGAQIIRSLNIRKMRLMSNNPTKRAGLIGYGLEITETVPLEIESNKHNELYLKTKRDRMGHTLKMDK